MRSGARQPGALLIGGAGLAFEAPAPFAKDKSLGEALLTPTRLYVKGALAAIHTGGIKGLAHITGGGLLENIPRVLPEGTHAIVDADAWEQPRLMAFLQAQGNIEFSKEGAFRSAKIAPIRLSPGDDAPACATTPSPLHRRSAR